jgi:uncharacterized membrane protein
MDLAADSAQVTEDGVDRRRNCFNLAQPYQAKNFSMKTFFLYAITLFAYLVFDQAWINGFAKGFIRRQVGPLLAPKPDLAAGIVFYLIFAGGLLYFCVLPALEAKSFRIALLNGALLGLVTYGTYELVNKALIDKWPLPLVVVDVLWGIFAGAAVSGVGFKAGKWLGL